MKYGTISAFIILLLGLCNVSFADSAMEQLQQMTHTDQHTGVKFDGSKQNQRRSASDVKVRVNSFNIETPPATEVSKSTSSYSVNASSNTVNTSSGTATSK